MHLQRSGIPSRCAEQVEAPDGIHIDATIPSATMEAMKSPVAFTMLLSLAGCETLPEYPNPRCSTEAECAAKIDAGRQWLLEHNYSVDEGRNDQVDARDSYFFITIGPPKEGEIRVFVGDKHILGSPIAIPDSAPEKERLRAEIARVMSAAEAR
jgi:hypothetical protein